MTYRASPAVAFAALLLAPTALLAQSTTKLSQSAGGATGSANSRGGASVDAVSPDGRFVTFSSLASNLVAGDVLGHEDIFLRDRSAGTIERLSFTTAGAEPNGDSSAPAISDDARFVAYQSTASNLAAGDFNGTWDIFVLDRQTGLTTIASAAGSGVIGNGASTNPTISGDGLRIAFASSATNLVPNDTNGQPDVFVRNLVNNAIKLVSRPAGGGLADGASGKPAISGNGAWIAFESAATNLVPGHQLAFTDIFVASFATGAIELVSVNSSGAQADASSSAPSLSRDGDRVCFSSQATNLASVASTVNNVFVRERGLGATRLVSALPGGASANSWATGAALSDNGSFAIYRSPASNLTSGHSGTASDAFVTELATQRTLRVSVPLTLPGEPNGLGVLEALGVSDDGRFAAFATPATNLISGEPADTISDVYLRDTQTVWYRDLDADTYGNPADTLSVSFPPPSGYVLVGGDCDDNNPAINPGATELCNGIDDDCDGAFDELAWNTYCAAGTSLAGCVPAISATGFPSVSQSAGFRVLAAGLPGQRSAATVYSLGQTSVAWAFGSTSLRCIVLPLARTDAQSTGGSTGQCNGTYDFDWLAFMAANPAALGQPIEAGDTFYAQVWYRDPGAARNSNLSNGLSFTLCP